MRELSTQNLSVLPPINELIRISKAVAMLDAILSPEWDLRYYSFDSRWSSGEMMASMRNGSGDEYFILFNDQGAAIKGFDHEAIMSPWNSDAGDIWPGIYDGIPPAFSSFLNESAFSIEDVTFCIWRRHTDATWQCGPVTFPPGEDPDGSKWMLEILGGDPKSYQRFAREYYEIDAALPVIEQVYALKPLTQNLVRALNRDITVDRLQSDAVEIGYPSEARS
jgi:hypothetical protein